MSHPTFQTFGSTPLQHTAVLYGAVLKYIKGNLKYSEASVYSRKKNKSAINLFHPMKLKAFKIKHFPRPCVSDMLHTHKVNLLIKHEYAIPLHMTEVFRRETSHRVGAHANMLFLFE